MKFFTFNCKQIRKIAPILVLWLSVFTYGQLKGQTTTGTINLGATSLSAPDATPASINSAPVSTNTAPANDQTLPQPATAPDTSAEPVPKPAAAVTPAPAPVQAPHEEPMPGWTILAALMTLASLGGFLLYQSGLIRAKNCGHAATLLVVGVTFGLIGYWMGGFAVDIGGIGDAHAALAQSIPADERSSLDHELGFTANGHHWGFMGSSGFFLMTDDTPSNASALLFLNQAVLLALVIAAALGASLERSRLLAMAVFSFLIGVVIYPLFANWVWGGGWLAELGREYGLGHGFVDLAGAGVVHETAGTLALVLAIVLGPRIGRFGKEKKSIPGHNMPFVLLGAVLLLISWTATNAFAAGNAGLAAVNTLLAAAAGLLISYLLASWQRRRPDPAFICRGLLGGAVASCGCSAMIDPAFAFLVGAIAALLIQGAIAFFEKRRIDDPAGAAAMHGIGGAWGVIATGLFANGSMGNGFNGVDGPIKGLFFGGAWHQLAAQAIGAVTGFVVVFILSYACLILIQKILGLRVPPTEEATGLDWSQTGAYGYQGDSEPETDSKS
jgi:Amt family ammonium transporter